MPTPEQDAYLQDTLGITPANYATSPADPVPATDPAPDTPSAPGPSPDGEPPRVLETLDRGDGSSTPQPVGASGNELASPAAAPLGGAFAWEFKLAVPEADLKYATAKGTLAYKLKAEPEDTAEADGKVTLKNGAPEYKAALEKHLQENVKLVGEGVISGKKGTIGIAAEFEGSKYSKTSIGFEVFEADATKGEVTFMALVWNAEFTIPGGIVDLLGVKWKYSGTIKPEIKLEPNYAAIGKEVGKQVVLRMTPVAAGVAGGIVGGLLLCAATMAAIGKLQDIGNQSTKVCQDGAQALRDYADSFAATLRGGSGPSKQGNADGEAHLKWIMDTIKISRDEAVEECKQSRNNYEQEAWERLRPKMRQSVLDGWKAAGGEKWRSIDSIIDDFISERY